MCTHTKEYTKEKISVSSFSNPAGWLRRIFTLKEKKPLESRNTRSRQIFRVYWFLELALVEYAHVHLALACVPAVRQSEHEKEFPYLVQSPAYVWIVHQNLQEDKKTRNKP